MKYARLALLLAATASCGIAQAALQGRDLDGDTLTDAFYDTVLDITWRRNANVNGRMTWANAESWAASYSFGGYSDWRLPTSDTSCTEFNCTGSEMGHLWYVDLANVAGDTTPNTGNFRFMQLYAYWSGTTDPQDSTQAFGFNIDQGDQFSAPKDGGDFALPFAMAVRPGDVTAAVPEPQTAALVLLALALTAVVRRKAN